MKTINGILYEKVPAVDCLGCVGHLGPLCQQLSDCGSEANGGVSMQWRPAVQAAPINETNIAGVWYHTEETPDLQCNRCAGEEGLSDLCIQLPACLRNVRSDGRQVIWLVDTGRNLVEQRRALRDFIGDHS